MTREDGGALAVRLHASGRLEMAWHLSIRGDAVAAFATADLRGLVEGGRRPDFPAQP